MHVNVIRHFLFSEMRKFCAICWTHFVDTALVVVAIKKLAGAAFVHPVAGRPLFVQPFFFEGFYRHSKMSRYTLHVLKSKCWRHCPATIRTCKAIGLGPNFFVYGIKKCI